ncbi:MAG TPA: bifunctional [glutamine synthetase] adenylyltransferase/[glutamine synthetase]-adenylyl-L-tyrosine phosphorylase, partial [Devosia sp.]|nr:bifunctional [glutamine synthetase] adenylyltransferase/[glutamine synthetase]-adenylyl-L-tyrosine phosphorylase [Devosia sp.]
MNPALRPLPPLAAHPQFTAWLDQLPPDERAAIAPAAGTLGPLLEAAPYLLGLAQANSEWLAGALAGPADDAFSDVIAEIDEAGRIAADEETLAPILRIGKGRTALLAAIAETGGVWTTAQATAALSDLADVALEAGLNLLMRQAAHRGVLTIPLEQATAENSGLAIFALGKHGGQELNYSSDIDIVAFYDPEKGVLAEPMEATRIYSRMVQRLVGLMEERRAHGYVFRTDLRLRPDPGSTPVAISFDAALAYYESRGQNWERAAWIKARACAGDRKVGAAFLKELAPYVWRKHLDFATIADIQAMKRQINIAKKVGDIRVEGHNVKLGRGGIREIEFFTQTQQLIAGGRDKSLRVKPTAHALAALADANWITPKASTELTQTYWFLRGVENRLQMLRDEQTHIMPATPAEIAIIGVLMGEPERRAFEVSYRAALERVAGYYAELFTQGETLGSGEGNLVFTGSDDDPGTLETLTEMGFKDASKAIETVRRWHYGSYPATRAAAARAHLTELLPALLKTLGDAGNADMAMAKFDDFLSRLPTGVQLFALLRSHANLRTLLVQLMASAPRMSEAVIHRAHVMDGLIDPAFANDVTHRDVLIAKVDAFLAEARSYEEVIDRARIIGQEQKFLIAAGLLSGTVSATGAGEQLTALAETLMNRLFASVRSEFERRHGTIAGGRVALLAFGKLASREMTVTSDIDFILLYD